LYAWALTVVPLAWHRGATLGARGASLVAPVGLLAAVIVEGRRQRWARLLSLWPLVSAAAIVWLLTPPPLFAERLEGLPTLLGMLGWGLFALAVGAPTPSRDRELVQRLVPGPPLQPRAKLPTAGRFWVVGAALVATALQLLAPEGANVERALLHRLAATAAGVALLGAATALGAGVPAAGHGESTSLRSVVPHAVALLVLAVAIALAPR
jgi:hypothetical protein